jgi:hypothetical protein
MFDFENFLKEELKNNNITDFESIHKNEIKIKKKEKEEEELLKRKENEKKEQEELEKKTINEVIIKSTENNIIFISDNSKFLN